MGWDGVVRREFEYLRRGTVSWFGVQDCATGAAAMLRGSERMDSVAFTEVLESLLEVHGREFVVVVNNGSAHTSNGHDGLAGAASGDRGGVHPEARVVGEYDRVGVQILTRQVLEHGCFEDRPACDRAVQAWVRDRNRARRPMSCTWQPAA